VSINHPPPPPHIPSLPPAPPSLAQRGLLKSRLALTKFSPLTPSFNCVSFCVSIPPPSPPSAHTQTFISSDFLASHPSPPFSSDLTGIMNRSRPLFYVCIEVEGQFLCSHQIVYDDNNLRFRLNFLPFSRPRFFTVALVLWHTWH